MGTRLNHCTWTYIENLLGPWWILLWATMMAMMITTATHTKTTTPATAPPVVAAVLVLSSPLDDVDIWVGSHRGLVKELITTGQLLSAETLSISPCILIAGPSSLHCSIYSSIFTEWSLARNDTMSASVSEHSKALLVMSSVVNPHMQSWLTFSCTEVVTSFSLSGTLSCCKMETRKCMTLHNTVSSRGEGVKQWLACLHVARLHTYTLKEDVLLWHYSNVPHNNPCVKSTWQCTLCAHALVILYTCRWLL